MNPQIFFTADHHFGHKVHLKQSKRPFKDVEEMNAELIYRWNSVVRVTDIVYHLGDFAVGYDHQIGSYAKRLNGIKILLLGGFDRPRETMLKAGFDKVYDRILRVFDGIPVFMSHHPQTQDKWEGADYHLAAHVHLAPRRVGNQFNVGVDAWDYTPRTLSELLSVPSDEEVVD